MKIFNRIYFFPGRWEKDPNRFMIQSMDKLEINKNLIQNFGEMKFYGINYSKLASKYEIRLNYNFATNNLDKKYFDYFMDI